MKNAKVVFVIVAVLCVLTTCSDDTTCPEPGPTPQPNYIYDLAAGAPDGPSVTLTWTAPSGAVEYDIRYYFSEINATNWDSTIQATGIPSPQPSGSTEIFRITGLEEDTEYYFAMKFTVDSQNWSALSNVATCFTSFYDTIGKIVFESAPGGDFHIYTMNLDGTDRRRLTHSVAENRHPSWSPDGLKILFYSQRDGHGQLYLMNADGSQQANLSQNDNHEFTPCFSPEGNRLAFLMDVPGSGNHVFTRNMDGTNLSQVTSDDKDHNYPAWSPDGSKITFSYLDLPTGVTLRTIAYDGSGPMTVLTDPTYYAWDPAWSPDGAKIAFRYDVPGAPGIYIMDADGSNKTRLTTDWACCPSWSPDGSQIVFSTDAADSDFEIYVINADGTNLRKITDNDYSDVSPAWSPMVGP